MDQLPRIWAGQGSAELLGLWINPSELDVPLSCVCTSGIIRGAATQLLVQKSQVVTCRKNGCYLSPSFAKATKIEGVETRVLHSFLHDFGEPDS